MITEPVTDNRREHASWPKASSFPGGADERNQAGIFARQD